MFGYHGRYLRIDLSAENVLPVPLAESVLRRFLGGVGLAAYLMHREGPAGADPLAPACPIIFSLSPLVGTPLTTSAKFAVVAKSPLTGMITDSHCGARHMRNSHLSTAECAKACVRGGANYILVDGDRHYILIGGEQSLSKLAGERANIIGTLQGDAILVNSAGALF